MSADPYIDQSRINEALIKRIIATGGDLVEVRFVCVCLWGILWGIGGWWLLLFVVGSVGRSEGAGASIDSSISSYTHAPTPTHAPGLVR